MMMEADDEDTAPEQDTEPPLEPVLTPVTDQDIPQISLQAMIGSSKYQTMRVKGWYYKKLLSILLDNGSTHKVLDLHKAKKLGCKLIAVEHMSITSGGGHKLEAPYICKGFRWTIHNQQFVADVYVLPLANCDLILGIQSLKSLGPILWYFDKLHMEFSVQGKKVVLRGAKTHGVKLISNEAMNLAMD